MKYYLEEGFPEGRVPKEALDGEFVDRESRAFYAMYRPQITALGVVAAAVLDRYTLDDHEAVVQYFDDAVSKSPYEVADFLHGNSRARYLEDFIEASKRDSDKFKALLELLIEFGHRWPGI
jgi:hypothetical protein